MTENATSIVKQNDAYYIASYSSSHTTGNKTSPSNAYLIGDPNWFLRKNIWFLKLDTDFNIIWDKTFGGAAREEGAFLVYADYDKLILSCLSESSGNGTGNKTTPNYGQEDVWVVITDLDGNILTQHNFGGTGEDYEGVSLGNTGTDLFLSVFTNSSASSIGNMSVVSNGGFDAWIADVDVQDWLTLAEENVSKTVKVYPNPTENNVFFSETVNSVTVANAQGKIVLTAQNTNYLTLENLPTGWYILEIQHNGKIERNKLIKR